MQEWEGAFIDSLPRPLDRSAPQCVPHTFALHCLSPLLPPFPLQTLHHTDTITGSSKGETMLALGAAEEEVPVSDPARFARGKRYIEQDLSLTLKENLVRQYEPPARWHRAQEEIDQLAQEKRACFIVREGAGNFRADKRRLASSVLGVGRHEAVGNGVYDAFTESQYPGATRPPWAAAKEELAEKQMAEEELRASGAYAVPLTEQGIRDLTVTAAVNSAKTASSISAAFYNMDNTGRRKPAGEAEGSSTGQWGLGGAEGGGAAGSTLRSVRNAALTSPMRHSATVAAAASAAGPGHRDSLDALQFSRKGSGAGGGAGGLDTTAEQAALEQQPQQQQEHFWQSLSHTSHSSSTGAAGSMHDQHSLSHSSSTAVSQAGKHYAAPRRIVMAELLQEPPELAPAPWMHMRPRFSSQEEKQAAYNAASRESAEHRQAMWKRGISSTIFATNVKPTIGIPIDPMKRFFREQLELAKAAKSKMKHFPSDLTATARAAAEKKESLARAQELKDIENLPED